MAILTIKHNVRQFIPEMNYREFLSEKFLKFGKKVKNFRCSIFRQTVMLHRLDGGWRRGWDSNPRAPVKGQGDFESPPLRPLRYLSGISEDRDQQTRPGFAGPAMVS